MQIKLVIENIDEIEKDSSFICLKSSSSISSWIIDYYFTNIYLNQIKLTNKIVQPKNIIGIYDMFMIYQIIQPSLSLIQFFDLCKNKLKQIKNHFLIENYNKYLNRCGLVDIIDLFHQCQFESFINTIILSINNIKTNIDRFFFQYLIELSSTSSYIYDIKTKSITKETNENLLKLIDNRKISPEPTNSKVRKLIEGIFKIRSRKLGSNRRVFPLFTLHPHPS